MQRLFKEYDLEIAAESNQKIVNYLDVTLNLKDGTFRPYHKPDDQIQYIHTESNHPPNIIKHIPASIETCLSNLPSTEIILKESTTHYENNLRQYEYSKKQKLEIASYKGDNLLNKRSELINKCRHQNKFTLLRHDSKD